MPLAVTQNKDTSEETKKGSPCADWSIWVCVYSYCAALVAGRALGDRFFDYILMITLIGKVVVVFGMMLGVISLVKKEPGKVRAVIGITINFLSFPGVL